MPPALDIYVLCLNRDRATIERFLDLFVDRKVAEHRSDEQLMMLPLGADHEPETLDEWDWEPAKTLANAVNRGLEYPRRCFALYLEPATSDVETTILQFTRDDKLILGLEIEDPDGDEDNVHWAEVLLNELCSEFSCDRGFIVDEQPPPLDEEEFISEALHEFTLRKRGI